MSKPSKKLYITRTGVSYQAAQNPPPSDGSAGAAAVAPSNGLSQIRQLSKENFVTSLTQNHDWRHAWIRAIALVWAEEEQNITNKTSTTPYKDELIGDAEKFFADYCDFLTPEALNISVKPSPTDTIWTPGDPKASDPEQKKWTWEVLQSELILYLPTKPPTEQVPVALAAYESAGLVYPFTVFCC
jgi:ribosomally synthesized peptide (two-chain TOMM family)